MEVLAFLGTVTPDYEYDIVCTFGVVGSAAAATWLAYFSGILVVLKVDEKKRRKHPVKHCASVTRFDPSLYRGQHRN